MYIHQAEQIKKIDNQASEQGFSLFSLMENAGRGLFEKISPLLKKENQTLILCGRGNNGGDGVVLARYLKQAGFHVSLVFPLSEPKTKTAKQHLDYYLQQDFTVEKWNTNDRYDVIIDCLLGIGTKLPLRSDVKNVVSWCNQQDALRIAVDIPSGVQADRGDLVVSEESEQPNIQLNHAFLADYTFSLHGYKPSIFLLPSGKYFGKTDVVSIGLKQTSNVNLLTEESVWKTFPKRNDAAHKGTFGTSLLVAGSDEMPGSAVLAAIGAIRSGTGKLIMATSHLAATTIASRVPEATFMLNGLETISEGEVPEKIIAAGIGPGIADITKAQKAVDELMKLDIPLVIDAGALRERKDWHARGPVIITPHPGEFSRLTGRSVKEIQANRIKLARKFSKKYDLAVVLKGKYSIIAFPNGETFVNPTGNSGLAKGGSGDVLTGMLVSMLATHDNYQDAVKNAVYIHGLCADIWIEKYSETSMVASDFAQLLPEVLGKIEGNR
ncbi:NAD(P)H-hydrate dehydratase [Cerasibacillus terrae]|uniref:Bifunctional NAD(P)H-hydrate repair enzyme n=1 Tax=Cerasibacillus terrae TaxID=2498845 RepID=A0A5C8NXD4_9BACI|nr:NAD(P)H-hydrate dehydratase [Cerasibacillus terrae]TXL65760.1 NAD(P)H-hydrate dehydratase [Cerasibacillus terrae]